MIIQAELKCKQTGCEAGPCAVDKVIELPSLGPAVSGAAAGTEDDVSKSGSIHLERAA